MNKMEENAQRSTDVLKAFEDMYEKLDVYKPVIDDCQKIAIKDNDLMGLTICKEFAKHAIDLGNVLKKLIDDMTLIDLMALRNDLRKAKEDILNGEEESTGE